MWPLESFTVKGGSHYTREQILALSGLQLGKPVTKADFDAARDRIVASGAFISVSCGYEPAADGKGYAATVEIVDVPELYPLEVEDLPVTGAEVQAFVAKKDPLAGPKIPGTKEALARYQSYLTELLAAKGYKDPIKGVLTSENPPQLIVLFRPAAPRPNISFVKFTGNQAIEAYVLQNKMAEVARGVPYDEKTFHVLLDRNIRPLYEAKGHMKITFPTVTTEPDPNVKGVIVSVRVDEGPVYKLAAVHVGGVANGPDLVRTADLKSGETINYDQVTAAIDRLNRNFRRLGYLDVATSAERTYHDQAKTVDITFHVTPGPQYKFVKLNVVGLDIETEPAIRKMWGLEAGKPFNANYPAHFLEAVKANGVFDNLKSTRSENHINRDDHTVEVTLYFNK